MYRHETRDRYEACLDSDGAMALTIGYGTSGNKILVDIHLSLNRWKTDVLVYLKLEFSKLAGKSFKLISQ